MWFEQGIFFILSTHKTYNHIKKPGCINFSRELGKDRVHSKKASTCSEHLKDLTIYNSRKYNWNTSRQPLELWTRSGEYSVNSNLSMNVESTSFGKSTSFLPCSEKRKRREQRFFTNICLDLWSSSFFFTTITRTKKRL